MLNSIWLGLILLAVVLGGAAGALDKVTAAAFKACQIAVIDLALPLIGMMALWLGIMRLAEKSGLIEILARALRPLMRRLFPDVPPEHPAMGSMLMNMAANMLGLGNSATALGLRAMKDLESLNPRPGTATNAMVTFLAINTSSIQIIPATTIAYLAAAGATQPTAIVGPAFFATVISTIVAVVMVKFFERLPGYRLPITIPEAAPTARLESPAAAPAATPETNFPARPLAPWAIALIGLFFLFFAWLGYEQIRKAAETGPGVTFTVVANAISLLAVPFVLSFFPFFAALKRVPVYEEFVEGAKEGFHVAIRVIPYLVAILVAIWMVRAAFDASAQFGWFRQVTGGLNTALAAIGFPPQLLPLVLMRPLSGSGSNGIFADLLKDPSAGGPDGFIARTAGCIIGSSETTFYVLAVYFGSVAIRRTRHAVPAGLLADLAGVIASIVICRLVFA
ncbi:MAG TPA: nucleoside recognition domain-containing protein [Chthoniobacterales bacterium]